MWYEVKEFSILPGYSNAKISRELGVDRRTVSKYLKMTEEEFLEFASKTRVYERLLDPYYNDVLSLLIDDRGLPAAVIEDRLKEKHPCFPRVNSKTVYNFVRHVRREEKIPVPARIRQTEAMDEVPFGSQAQVDFGTALMRRQDGSRQRVYFFALVLSRSRYKYVFFQTTPFTAKTAVLAHELALAFIEGIPVKLLYDQDPVILNNENLGDYLLTEEFRSYRHERGMNMVFCRKSDPQSKGKVENVIGYVKNNFLRARTFHDIDRLNDEALGWLERTANGTPHSTTKRLPRDEWVIEKEHLAPFTPSPVIPRQVLSLYTVRKDNTVSYKGNFYRVPRGTYDGKGTEVSLEVKDGVLSLYDRRGNPVAEHPVSREKGRVVGGATYRQDRDARLEPLKKEVLSLWKGNGAMELFMDQIHEEKPRYLRDHLKVIREVISEHVKETTEKALEYCIENGLHNANRLKEAAAYYRELKLRGTELPPEAGVPREGVQTHRYATGAYTPQRSKINRYDQIMEV